MRQNRQMPRPPFLVLGLSRRRRQDASGESYVDDDTSSTRHMSAFVTSPSPRWAADTSGSDDSALHRAQEHADLGKAGHSETDHLARLTGE
jgi:hypothetical protein